MTTNLALKEIEAPAVIDIGVSREEAYARGMVDINFFAALALPNVCIYALPAFYVAIWQILANREPKNIGKILRFALGLPRGHAKTTFIKLIACWLLVYDKTTFILIVCANEFLAEQFLADVSDILGSPNMEAVYGDWTRILATNSVDLKKGIYHKRPVVLAAKGAQSALRGLNINNQRPDFILLDDAQTRENDESESDSAKLLRWMVGTLFFALAPSGDRLIIYVGNMYSDTCILKLLQDNPAWISFITGAILNDKEPLWAELHSLNSLMESFHHDAALGLGDIWFAEVMNDPRSKALSLLKTKLPSCPWDIQEIQPDSVFLTIDPAGFRSNSDDNVIVVHYVYEQKGIIRETKKGIFRPDELIKEALILALTHGASLIGVEDVGYQQTLAFWLQHFMTEFGITNITIVALKPHGRSKETRIKQFISELEAGNYYHGTAETEADFIWQASNYKLGAKKNKDDLLDAEAYGLDVRNDYWTYLTTVNHTKRLAETSKVVGNNTPF